MSHEALAKTFDAWAESGRAEGMESGHSDVVHQVVEKLGIRPGQQILDLGCGNGWATRLLAKSTPGAGAVGIDVSPGMIARAEELHSYTIRARYEVGRFEELPLDDQKFDRIFSMEAMYYATDLPKALSEAHRVLKDGGKADIVVDYYEENEGSHSWSHLADDGGFAMHRLSDADWRAAFESAGFKNVETERVLDRRGPGEEADFEPNESYPSWEHKVKRFEAGSLWIRAEK